MFLAPLIWRLLRSTLSSPPLNSEIPLDDGPVIFACLHRDIIGAILHVAPTRPSLLVSNSDDGLILVKTLGDRDYGFIRGATGENGGRALVHLRRALENGSHIGLAVDGPKGPFGEIHSGVFQLAKLTGAPIVPLLPVFSPSLAVKTWDRTELPYLFSRLSVHNGPIMRVSPEAGEEEIRKMHEQLHHFFSRGAEGNVKIVDYRSFLVRRFARSDKKPSPPGLVGRWLGKIVDATVARRVSQRPEPPSRPLLVSIGNLALGGTGKTPVVMALAQGLADLGLKGAILTRGYGSSISGPLVVTPENEHAGDEARMMAHRLSDLDWPIVQSRHRPRGLQFIRNFPDLPDIILLEDAHQTGGLARHLDLLILDSWDIERKNDDSVLKPSTGPVFPLGPWRETARGSQRAGALLIEGGENPPEVSDFGLPVFSFGRKVKLQTVYGEECSNKDHDWALLSGIARPVRFETAAVECLGKPGVVVIRCRDHAGYNRQMYIKIISEMDETGATGLVTTAKDWIKLAAFWGDSRPVKVLDMELEWAKKNALNQWLVERVEHLSS